MSAVPNDRLFKLVRGYLGPDEIEILWQDLQFLYAATRAGSFCFATADEIDDDALVAALSQVFNTVYQPADIVFLLLHHPFRAPEWISRNTWGRIVGSIKDKFEENPRGSLGHSLSKDLRYSFDPELSSVLGTECLREIYGLTGSLVSLCHVDSCIRDISQDVPAHVVDLLGENLRDYLACYVGCILAEKQDPGNEWGKKAQILRPLLQQMAKGCIPLAHHADMPYYIVVCR